MADYIALSKLIHLTFSPCRDDSAGENDLVKDLGRLWTERENEGLLAKEAGNLPSRQERLDTCRETFRSWYNKHLGIAPSSGYVKATSRTLEAQMVIPIPPLDPLKPIPSQVP